MNSISKLTTILATFGLIVLFGPDLRAQNKLNNKTIIENQHVEFINKLTKNLAESQDCLLSLYWQLEPGRNPKTSFYHIGGGYTCGRLIYEKDFENLLNTTKNATVNHALELNTHAQKIYDIFLKINQLCRELEIYIRLEDYKKDRLQTSDKIYHQLKLAFTEYIIVKEEYYKYLEGINKQRIKSISSAKIKDYQEMKRYLMDEEKFLMGMKINFCSKTFTSTLQIDSVVAQITSSDNFLSSMLANSENNSFVRNFISGSKRTLQETKRKAVDNYSKDARKSDAYANSFIKNYLFYLNEFVLKDFYDYVHNENIPLLLYPKCIAAFKLDSAKKEYVQKKLKYVPNEIPPLTVQKKNTEISANEANALNNYIKFVNIEIHFNCYLPTKLYYLNSSANRQLERNDKDLYLSFDYYSQYALPSAAYEKTINESQVFDSNTREILNLLLNELNDIIKEKYELALDLTEYVKQKKFREDRYTRLYEILERYEYLIDMFESQKQLLYAYTRKIYESYKANTAIPWYKGAVEMLRQLDTNLNAFNKVEQEFKMETYQPVASTSINDLSRNMILKEYENLQGLKKYGSNNGNCPYSPYEDIATGSQDFVEYFTKFPNQDRIKRDWQGYYDDFVYRYNDLIEDYNKFVELAAGGYEAFQWHKTSPVYLLQKVKESMFFKFEKPKKQKEKVDIEPAKDTSSISMEGFAANNLVLLLDISGSMRAEDKLPLLRESFLKILPYLRDEDEISIVAFAGKGAVLLKPISCSEKEKITEVLQSLESKGQSNFDKGLAMAYKVAHSNFSPNANNRILIATDGAFIIDDKLYKQAKDESDNKIFLSVFSFGNKDNKVRSLDKLADMGKGNYEYIEVTNAMDKLLRELQALKVE